MEILPVASESVCRPERYSSGLCRDDSDESVHRNASLDKLSSSRREPQCRSVGRSVGSKEGTKLRITKKKRERDSEPGDYIAHRVAL